MKKFLLITVLTIVLLVVGFFILLNLHIFEPAYYEAKRDCYERVQIGMTFEEVERAVGHLFAEGPYGIDENGDGQVYLRNDIKYAEGACNIRFEQGRVIFNELLFVFL